MSINVVDVGTPPDGMSDEWTTTVVRFHGFANLSTTRDDYVLSPKFSCFDHQWALRIYPGGRANSDEGRVAVSLCNLTNSCRIKIRWGCSIRNADGKEVEHRKSYADEFHDHGSGSAWAIPDFAKRSTLMELLVKGSLIIEVRMKPTSTDKSITQFIPTNPINKNVLKLFMNEETADVVFEVGGEQHAKGRRKKTKSSTTFRAHQNILQNCAPTLYEMCGDVTPTVVSITDVKPDIFKHMIYYAYGGKLSDEDLKDNAKDIINACDKYGVVHLKLEAEACYVESIELSMDNIMDNLLYADSKNLALLKEAVMDYIVKNKTSIIGKVSFNDFPGHLAADLLTAMARGEEQTGEEDESNKYVKMRVGTLRKMLDEKGLDVDGSRESMIALLKEHNEDSDDEDE